LGQGLYRHPWEDISYINPAESVAFPMFNNPVNTE